MCSLLLEVRGNHDLFRPNLATACVQPVRTYGIVLEGSSGHDRIEGAGETGVSVMNDLVKNLVLVMAVVSSWFVHQ